MKRLLLILLVGIGLCLAALAPSIVGAQEPTLMANPYSADATEPKASPSPSPSSVAPPTPPGGAGTPLDTPKPPSHPDIVQNPEGWISWWVRGVSGGKFTFWFGCSSLLLAALVITRRFWPAPFASDFGGTLFAFSAAVLGAMVTTAASNAAIGLATFAAAFKVGVGATGGYSVLWKKIARPLLVHLGVVKPQVKVQPVVPPPA